MTPQDTGLVELNGHAANGSQAISEATAVKEDADGHQSVVRMQLADLPPAPVSDKKEEPVTGELFGLEVQPEELLPTNGGVKTSLAEAAEQAELPTSASEVEVATDEAASLVSETAVEAEVEQEEFPALVSAIQASELESEDEEELGGEPTGKLSAL